MATEPFQALPAANPAAATMPPRGGPPAGYDPLAPPPGAPDYDPMLDPSAAPLEGDPMLGQVGDPDDLDDAPTRIEHEEEIKANIGAPGGPDVPRVVIIGGNNRGKEYPLLMGDNSLGRGVDNNVILADIAVSRKHTLICYEAGSYVVRDLGSGNGTLLNSKRVDSHPLQDGDQLELGNTMLRFISPVQPALVAPANVDAIAKLETVVTPRGVAEEMRMTADVPAQPLGADGTAAVQQATRREPRGIKGLNRTMKLLIFGGGAVVVLFGLMIVLKLTLSGQGPAQGVATKAAARPPDEIAAQEFQEGTTQYRARNWEKARLHFLKVLKLAPSFDQAKHYAEQASVEISAASTLDRARNSLRARDYKTVRSELSKIPSTSTYAGDARTLKQKVDDEQVAKLLEAARTLKAAGDNEGARGKVKEARTIAPTNKAVLELYGQLSGSTTAVAVKRPATAHHRPRPRPYRASPAVRPRHPRARPGRAAPRATMIKVRGKAKIALNHYRQRQWGQALKEAKTYASSLSGRRKGQADKLANAIHKVGMSWNRAEHMSKSSAKLKYYQLALKYDARIPRKPHQRALKKLIAGTATKVATNAITKKKYASAYAAVKLAERYGGGDPLMNKVKKSLEAKAMQLFTRGYTMRSSNKTKARRLWQQVLRMVPPSSKAYQKAYMWLNNSTPTYQDEDED